MPITEETARAAVERLSNTLTHRRPKIQKRLAYFKGEEGRMRFASDEFRDYHMRRFQGFSDNWCLTVGQATAERMRHLGIRFDGDALADAEMRRVLVANEAQREMNEAFQVFGVASRSFVLVSPNPADKSTPLVTFEHPSQAVVEYDPFTRQRRYGLVVWTDDKYDYATLYTADEVWKWQRSTNTDRQPGQEETPTPLDAWEPRPVEGESWPAAHTLGAVPLVELRNGSLLDDEPLSDIDGVMSMQDAVNLVWAYLLNALDYVSLPQRVVMGGEIPQVPVLDENGQEIGTRPIELDELIRERIMFLPAGTTIGEWTAAQIDGFIAVIREAIEHLASQTRTPPHYLSAKLINTAAESLTISEAGLVSKTRERIDYVDPGLREMYRLIAMAKGDAEKARAVMTAELLWADIQYRSEAQRSDALSKKRTIGYPVEYLLELDGVPPHRIPQVMAMIEAERSDPTLEQLAREAVAVNPEPSDAPVDE